MLDIAATMESLYTVEYQQWHTLSEDLIRSYVAGGIIDAAAFKRITGDDYHAQNSPTEQA